MPRKTTAALKKAILAHFGSMAADNVLTPREGLLLGVRTEPFPRTPVLYEASVCFLAQGSKAVHLGPHECSYDSGHFLLSRFNVTAESSASGISKRRPLVGMAIDLNMARLGQVVAEVGPGPVENAEGDKPALTSHPMGDALLDVLERFVETARNEVAWRVLSEGLLRELYYQLVRGPAGPLLRERAANVGNSRQVAAAIDYINRNLTDVLGTEAIARAAGVSVSGLHAKFRAVTGQAPMQFVKRLRLDRARTLILSGESVAQAAQASGYNSSSQFSREFSREYGMPPSQLRNL